MISTELNASIKSADNLLNSFIDKSTSLSFFKCATINGSMDDKELFARLNDLRLKEDLRKSKKNIKKLFR